MSEHYVGVPTSGMLAHTTVLVVSTKCLPPDASGCYSITDSHQVNSHPRI